MIPRIVTSFGVRCAVGSRVGAIHPILPLARPWCNIAAEKRRAIVVLMRSRSSRAADCGTADCRTGCCTRERCAGVGRGRRGRGGGGFGSNLGRQWHPASRTSCRCGTESRHARCAIAICARRSVEGHPSWFRYGRMLSHLWSILISRPRRRYRGSMRG